MYSFYLLLKNWYCKKSYYRLSNLSLLEHWFLENKKLDKLEAKKRSTIYVQGMLIKKVFFIEGFQKNIKLHYFFNFKFAFLWLIVILLADNWKLFCIKQVYLWQDFFFSCVHPDNYYYFKINKQYKKSIFIWYIFNIYRLSIIWWVVFVVIEIYV